MRSRPSWWLAVLESAVLMPWVAISLRTRGYARTVRSAVKGSSGGQPAPGSGAPTPLAVRVVTSAVTVVAGRQQRGTCLPRAITILWLSRRRGHAVELCMGVAAPTGDALPAHAWVEYGGRPLNDTADVRQRYHVLPMPPTTS
jgi:hypothetical protein